MDVRGLLTCIGPSTGKSLCAVRVEEAGSPDKRQGADPIETKEVGSLETQLGTAEKAIFVQRYPEGRRAVSFSGEAEASQPPHPSTGVCSGDLEEGLGVDNVGNVRRDSRSGGVQGRCRGCGMGVDSVWDLGSWEARFAVYRMPGVCWGEIKVYLDSPLQLTSHLYAFYFMLNLLLPFFVVAGLLELSSDGEGRLFTASSDMVFVRIKTISVSVALFVFHPSGAYLVYALCMLYIRIRFLGTLLKMFLPYILYSFAMLQLFVLQYIKFLGSRAGDNWPALNIIASASVFLFFISIFQFICLLLQPLSPIDRILSLGGLCILLSKTAVGVAYVALVSPRESVALDPDSQGQTPVIPLLYFLFSVLFFSISNFVRRSIPRKFTIGEVKDMMQVSGGNTFFFRRILSVELFNKTLIETGKHKRVQEESTLALPDSGESGKGEVGKSINQRQRDIKGERKSGGMSFYGIVLIVWQRLSGWVEKILSPPHHHNTECIAFTVGVVLLVFDFLTDVYIGGLMRGLGGKEAYEGHVSKKDIDRRHRFCSGHEEGQEVCRNCWMNEEEQWICHDLSCTWFDSRVPPASCF